ncbi:hypothetical protein PR048_025513 [Dryococelus australis]|uniref:Polyprotein n=1 Tax=Dryococelus australis TaxID=614101 RepID=A0ABQ9GRJ2_9NEOP|nr:hypothetical protein PR048_025513 [Dryococelus australis]
MQQQNINIHLHLNMTRITLGRTQQCTMADGGLQALVTIIKEDWLARKNDLRVYVGTIFRGERLVVLQEMRTEMIRKAHANPKGLEASVRKVRETMHWPHMGDVERKTQRGGTGVMPNVADIYRGFSDYRRHREGEEDLPIAAEI